MQRIIRLATIAIALTACRKPEPPPPAPVPVAPSPGSPAPAPVTPVPQATPEHKADAAAPAPQGNWFSLKTPAEKQEIMEGWLHQYASGTAATKAEILKQVQNSKLSPADRAMVEQIRARLKLPPMPLQ
jgi:hypothetical protein